ncbi:hypothetical protein [Lederbergia galactosidilytica]|uniref:Uncharacterized protein n=1 Tax=Lederbergia galactosidilytica TaxID=217031 RepID=A0A177ZRH8_9BACI|nr:hypothetical protein [Lederbergia galactosidilytica]OAK70089.1 hypothetical protein ABB05_12985 [Lederbergia galactosidilytica]
MKQLYIWLVAMIKSLFGKGGLPAEMEEQKEMEFLPFDLQYFAEDPEDPEDPDDSDDPEDPEDPEDDIPDIDELLKDPVFKKQYNKKLKDQLSKRMKRHNKELERLKGKGKDKDDEKGTDDEEERSQEDEKRLLRAEHREKRALVKEFAVDNGHNPRLLARLIDLNEIELDEDGEPENLDELFEELEEEFPEYFGAVEDDEDEEEEERPRKKKFTPGARQKMNKEKKVNPKEAGRQKALERHKKKEEK